MIARLNAAASAGGGGIVFRKEPPNANLLNFV